MSSKSSKMVPITIYLLLTFSLATYVIPVISVQIPGVADYKWSVADVVRSLPKPSFEKKDEKPALDIDFQELLNRLFPEGKSKDMKINPTVAFVALMPIALALAYLMVLLGFIVGLFRSRFLTRWTSGLAMVFSGYALSAVYVLGDISKQKFSVDKVDPLKSPLEFLGKTFAKQIDIEPETGLFVLVLFTALLYLFTFFRPKRIY